MVGNYIDEETGKVWCIALLDEVRDTNRKLDKIIKILDNAKDPYVQASFVFEVPLDLSPPPQLLYVSFKVIAGANKMPILFREIIKNKCINKIITEVPTGPWLQILPSPYEPLKSSNGLLLRWLFIYLLSPVHQLFSVFLLISYVLD